jgi:hypothetical protein
MTVPIEMRKICSSDWQVDYQRGTGKNMKDLFLDTLPLFLGGNKIIVKFL